MVQELPKIAAEAGAELRQMGLNFPQVLAGGLPGRDLLREQDIFAPGAQEQLPAVHPRAGEIGDYGLFTREAEDDYDTARLIFPQKAPGGAAEDENGQFIPVALHVDARPVACGALHKDAAAPLIMDKIMAE